MATLKRSNGKFILAHGGASFAQSLVKHNLIDEFRLVVHPVVLGKGIPLFAEVTIPMFLRLESSDVFEKGIIANIYRPN
jgi:dihydrofolate reductase